MILQLLLLLIGILLAAGLGLLVWCCGRRGVPDYWDASALLSHGFGARRDEILAGKAWLETQQLERIETFSDDELVLRGTFLRRKKGALGTIVLLHDTRSSWKLDFSGIAKFLYEQGYQLLFADQRAHGGSRGLWTTYGIWERFDVRGWTSYLTMRFGDSHSIWIYGCGMGGTAALMASSLELSGVVRGIIAEDAYSEPYEHLKRGAENYFSPLPVSPALWLLDRFAAAFVGFSLGSYSAVTALKESRYPILLIHGTDNRRTPIAVAESLQGSAPEGTCGLLRVNGADKGLCRATDPEAVQDALRRFFRDA